MSDYTYTQISYIKSKNRTIKNIILISLAVILLINIISFIKGYKNYKLLENTSSNVEPFTKNTLLEYTQVSFYSNDEKTLLKGWFFNNQDSNKIIIVSHGFMQNRKLFGNDTDIFINSFLNNGFSLLLFDYRGSGNTLSGNYTCGYMESLDLSAAISYANALNKTEIYILAFDSGANATLNLDNEALKPVKSLILDSPYMQANELIKKIADVNDKSTFLFSNFYTKLLIRISGSSKKLKTQINLQDTNIHIISSQFSKLGNNESEKIYDILKTKNNASLDLASEYNSIDKYCTYILDYLSELEGEEE